MDPGEALTRWTVRISLACYASSLLLRFFSRGRRNWLVVARQAWTVGCLALLLHLVCAFHFIHDWSHRAAYEATAQQTEQVVGLSWGGGIWANYFFALLWLADVFWWWRDPTGYHTRPRIIEWAIQGFMAFIIFNATVVFRTGAIRWIGVCVCLLLAAVLGYAAYRRRTAT